MKKERPAPALTHPGKYEETFQNPTGTSLAIHVRWVQLEETCAGCRRVNRYYNALVERWKHRWLHTLLPRAKSAETSSPWSVYLDFTTTFFQDGLFSLYWEVTENTGQRRPRKLRFGDTWQLPMGTPVLLPELLPAQHRNRNWILEEIRSQIGELLQTGESIYFDNWFSLVARRFSSERFFLTAEGLAVFYPMESIAPAMEGFPTFLLPETRNIPVC